MLAGDVALVPHHQEMTGEADSTVPGGKLARWAMPE